MPKAEKELMPIYKKNYLLVSKIYPHLMRKINYKYWSDYLVMLSENYVTNKSNVLELGAGNCLLAFYLKDNFKNIIATDLSFSMLNSSKDKKVKNPPEVFFTLIGKKSRAHKIAIKVFRKWDNPQKVLNLAEIISESLRMKNGRPVLTYPVSRTGNSTPLRPNLNK